jgi:hypothetical protein
MREKIIYKGKIWFEIKCDSCDEKLTNHDGFNLFPDENSAENIAMEEQWTNDKHMNKYYCSACASRADMYNS